jgi:hypothetical protein
VPYGFWRQFVTEELHVQYNDRRRMQTLRALSFYAVRIEAGAKTRQALRGMRKRKSFRASGGASNAMKAPGLGFSLLQYFVDHIQKLMCRADSNLLMQKARNLRVDLLHAGWAESSLPKLVGCAGGAWFLRWRRRYGITKVVTGMKLKVAWHKVKQRVQVLLGNIFRLRAFWELCHPGREMRWLSVDQKPSWFNNAGLTGTFAKKGSQPSVREIFAHTRQRYTVLTSVPSWGHSTSPPKVAVLFKAAPGGTVIRGLRAIPFEPWMKVQVQENGSYRSGDVVEALDWMLPAASCSEDSVVVLLDWFSGHLTEEVAALVKAKGHVLLFHGGGTTPFTQINDTHLHATLARMLIQLENEWALNERHASWCAGQNKTPNPTRFDIVQLVQCAWAGIDHSVVAAKGYKQTGPTMPLTGPVHPSHVFTDLLKVIQSCDPTSTPLEVGMTLRDEAVAFVKDGFDSGKWRTWADCHKLIEEHVDGGPPLEEGLEAFGADPYDEDGGEDGDEAGDEDGGEDDGDTSGLSAKPPDGPSGADGPEGPDGPEHDEEGLFGPDDEYGDAGDGDDGEDGDDGAGGGAGSVAHVGGADGPADVAAHPGAVDEAAEAARLRSVADARQVLYDDAMRNRDDLTLRRMRTEIQKDNSHQQ